MSEETQATGGTAHTSHQLGRPGERALVQTAIYIPGVILHISHQSLLTMSQKLPRDRTWILTQLDRSHLTFRG